MKLGTEEPFVSIIIPTHNSEKTIEKCLESIFNINYPREKFEVILIDDSSDSTPIIAQRFPVVLYTLKAKPGKKRNFGVKNAKGTIIAFIDDDCFVTKDWLYEIVRSFRSPDIGSVGGPNLTPPDDKLLGKCLGIVLSSNIGSGGLRYARIYNEERFVDHNPTCNCAVVKKYFQEVGGFREDIWPSEDVEFDIRLRKAGYKLLYNPRAIVWHKRKDTFKDIFKMIFRYGRNRVKISRIHREALKPIHVLPSVAFLLYCFSLTLAFLQVKHFFELSTLLTITYFAPIFIYSIRVIKRKLSMLPLLIVTFCLVHLAWALGFIIGVLDEIK